MESEQILKEREEEKQKMADKMKIYRETLKYQQEILEVNKDRYGSMTQQEKHLNRPDLRDYKHNGTEVKALIPGLNNLSSIGSVPTLRKAYNPASQSMTPQDFAKEMFSKTDREIAQMAVNSVRDSPPPSH